MTKTEAREFLGVSERTLEGYVKKGRLTVRYVRGKTSQRADFDADELERLKSELEAPTDRAAIEAPQSPQMGAEPGQKGVVVSKTATSQNTALATLRGVPTGAAGTSLLAIAPEHFPALVQALSSAASSQNAVPIANRLTLDLDGAAALSGFSRGSIRAAIAAGQLPARKMGRGWKIERAALEAWVKNLFAEPNSKGRKRA
jgi:excisionase family DNA binding protein